MSNLDASPEEVLFMIYTLLTYSSTMSLSLTFQVEEMLKSEEVVRELGQDQVSNVSANDLSWLPRVVIQ